MLELVKTAGMVQGTPDWQRDLMQGEQNEVNSLEQFDFDTLNEAHSCLSVPVLDCGALRKYITMAMDAIPGTPEAAKLASIVDAVAVLHAEIVEIRKQMYGLMFPEKAVNE